MNAQINLIESAAWHMVKSELRDRNAGRIADAERTHARLLATVGRAPEPWVILEKLAKRLAVPPR